VDNNNNSSVALVRERTIPPERPGGWKVGRICMGGYVNSWLVSNVNKPPYATMIGARFYCALTLHVSVPIGGHLQVICDKIYSKIATFMSTDPLSRHI
jgi:hypothetical protein